MSIITLSDDVLIHIISFLCIYDVRSTSEACRVLYENIKKHSLLSGALSRYGVSLPFKAVRYCENQNVYRFAEENVLRALRPAKEHLQGAFFFKLQDDGSVCVALRLAAFDMRDEYMFDFDRFMSYVPRKTTTRTNMARCFLSSEKSNVDFWPYGHYLRMRLRHNSQSFLLANELYTNEAGELLINPFKEMHAKLHAFKERLFDRNVHYH